MPRVCSISATGSSQRRAATASSTDSSTWLRTQRHARCAREHVEGHAMSTDTERRLRAALEASAELITDPPGSADYQPAAAGPASGDHPKARRLRRRRWVAPPLAAAAVAVIAVGATVIVRAVNTDHGA